MHFLSDLLLLKVHTQEQHISDQVLTGYSFVPFFLRVNNPDHLGLDIT